VRLLLDEPHSPRVAEALRKAGFEVVAAGEDDATRNLSDADLLGLAAEAGRALVTGNARDFALLAVQWAAEGRPHAGIVLTHPEKFDRARSSYPGMLIAALEQFLTSPSPPVGGESWVYWL
jgi:predicted nuclease of predicted toxin-antitoxin system